MSESQSQSQLWMSGAPNSSDAPAITAAKPALPAKEDVDAKQSAGGASSVITSPAVQAAGSGSSSVKPTAAAHDEINAKKAAVAKKVKGELIRFLTT